MKKGDTVRLKKAVQPKGKREKARIKIHYRSGAVVVDKPLHGGFRMWNQADLERCSPTKDKCLIARLKWKKVRAGRLWHAKSMVDGPLIGFIRKDGGFWECFLTVPGKKWPNAERRIGTCRNFNDAKLAVEEEAR